MQGYPIGHDGTALNGAHSVIASLLGIPFNLKAATELTDGAALTAFCLFYTDDALTGQLCQRLPKVP